MLKKFFCRPPLFLRTIPRTGMPARIRRPKTRPGGLPAAYRRPIQFG